ncbi:lipopolysaccharide biosynthesis protein [Thalassomonas sp. M1454]|uniref:lipopolysaccharide biosynthesis protein n=1 Tax=Thalassomonas sp. M1454 TaxID=2594477 RepID=UPI00117CCC13|nr:lipopolysaccharide biosynthesis protein [Thalassomonas sp. M1454]TRX57411.1 lipopolysaccharide biosynthesis protein [Thalassomonas sp. M1454]
MSQKEINKIENRFNDLKQLATHAEWGNPAYIVRLSKKFEEKDLALAYRLMQRAHILKPEGPVVNERLNLLVEKLKKENPKALKSGSSKAKTKIDILANHWLKKINQLPAWSRNSLFVFVALPWLVFAFYQIMWASERFESQSQVVVKQPDDMATLDAGMAMLSGLGVATSDADTELVSAYIYSNDMISYLDNELGLREHYSSFSNDFFSRLHLWSTREDFYDYYQNHILVELDEMSSVLTIKAQAFTADYAEKLNQKLIERAEWFINNVGHQMAKEQLAFVKGEHDLVALKLDKAKNKLLEFQSKNNLLDPEAEGVAYQEIAYTLEANLSAKKAELYAMEAVMSDTSPQIRSLKRVIEALEQQIIDENRRLSGSETNEQLTVGEKMAQFADYKIDLELALQAYASSLVSLEKSRVEAYRKLQYLVVIEKSTLPEDNTYPEVIYNLSLFAVILLMLFAIIRIVKATIRELN